MPSPRLSGERKPPLVLVVDDFPDGRQLVVDMLQYYGFDVAEAANGLDALDLTRSLRPDLVVLDLALPGVDGWEVAQRLKGDPSTRGIRILAITAHAEELALQRARDAGSDLVMTKPCAPDLLLAAVRELVEERDGNASPKSRTPKFKRPPRS